MYNVEVATFTQLYADTVSVPPVPAALLDAVEEHERVHAVASKSHVASATPAVVVEHGWPGYVKVPLKMDSALSVGRPHVQESSAGRPQPTVQVPAAQMLEQTALDPGVQVDM